MIAMLSSAFIYLNHWGFSYPILNTFLGLFSLYLLLQSHTVTWFITGAFIGLFWFWWISLSLIHYEMLWVVPLEIILIMLSYGLLFWTISWVSEKLSSLSVGCCGETTPDLLTLFLKATGLLVISYLHPFSFDWLKPELMFVESYIGIEKWQFAIVLLSIILSIWRGQFLYLIFVVLASGSFSNITSPTTIKSIENNLEKIQIVTTHTSVQDKWNESLHQKQFDAVLEIIDQAIKDKKSLIILPESVFPIFLNRSKELLVLLEEKAKHIAVVIGALYWDGETPRNSTYIFTEGKIQIANKVVLVPFGESNPLPDFLSDWVNRVFYDNAIDYKASTEISDYCIDGTTYRNAICFEATSEKLYVGKPQHMIVLSNNGWFIPSIEPSLQKLLLQYYSKKYGTDIYHSVNMSDSYVIMDGEVHQLQTL